MHVIATAGHVDHGKTSLLRALTGMEPSRLAEERRRAMTLQLGYVWMAGPDPAADPIGIVDVPGHAAHRLTMLSGASAADAFIFVCAAPDGWAAQSEEHLWALATFGVRAGVVALSKTDLATPERVAELTAELQLRFLEALGREIPVVPVSAATGAGLDALRAQLFAELAAPRRAPDIGRPQMFVDRVFTVPGQGTVVTGTLRDGALTVKDRIELIPSGKRAQIRSIQCYGRDVRVARPTARVALQIAGLAASDVAKDEQLAVCGNIYRTTLVDVRLRPFGDLPPRRADPRVIVVHGGVRTPARMIRMPGPYVRLALEKPRWLRFDERVLVTSSGGDRVLGGGEVVDEAAVRGVRKAADRLPLVQDFCLYEYLSLQIAKAGFMRRSAITQRTRFSPATLDADLAACAQDFAVIDDDWLCDPARVAAWRDAVLAAVDARHRDHPTEDGLPETLLPRRLRLPEELARALVRGLKAEGALTQTGPSLRRPAFAPKVETTDALAPRLDALAANPAPVAVTLADLGVTGEHQRRVVARYVADGKLVRLDDRHLMGKPAFTMLSDSILAVLTGRGPATAAELRDQLGLGRKLVIQVLEAMDTLRLTQRDGDRRRATPASSARPL